MFNMAKFNVKWEIDIEAESSIDAAWQALDIQQDPDSIAIVFVVKDSTGKREIIDLEEHKRKNKE